MSKKRMAMAVLGVLWVSLSWAQAPAPAPSAATTTTMVDAEVRKIDKEAQKVTLRHGPIPNLDMPAMTMVFRVADPTVLDRLTVGGKVRFRAEKVDGQYTVTELVSAN
jgi:Cu/Ag efflux protein CusF